MTDTVSLPETAPRGRVAFAPTLLALGAALVILGPFLRWAEIEVPRINFHSSATGMDLTRGRGWVLVGCGVCALLVGLLPNVTVRNATALVVGAFAAGLTYSVFADFIVADEYTVGLGLWMTALGAALVIVGGFAGLLSSDRRA